MRIDKFLQVTGLVKRRALACEACKRGLVTVNSIQAKPTREVKLDDEIELLLPGRHLKVRVVGLLEKPNLPKSRRDEIFEVLYNTPQ